MSRVGWMVGVLLVLAPAAWADDGDVSGSVAVKLMTPVRGSAPVLVEAYGALTPGPGGETTLSLPVDAQLVRRAVVSGQAVRQGDLLVRMALSPQAEAARIQARAAVKLAQAQLTHEQALFARQLTTRDQLAFAENGVINARSAAKALDAAGGDVRAPFDGVVTALPVGEGERVAAGAALVTLTRTGALVARLGVEPGDQAKIRAKQMVELSRLAGQEGAGQGGAGQGGAGPGGAGPGTAAEKVLQVGGVVDAKSGLVSVTTAAPQGWLGGEAVAAEITVDSVTGWLLPRDAVLDDDQGAYLFQAADGKARRVGVTRLGFLGGWVVVQGAVDPSLGVVVEGNYQLDNGAALRVVAQ